MAEERRVRGGGGGAGVHAFLVIDSQLQLPLAGREGLDVEHGVRLEEVPRGPPLLAVIHNTSSPLLFPLSMRPPVASLLAQFLVALSGCLIAAAPPAVCATRVLFGSEGCAA